VSAPPLVHAGTCSCGHPKIRRGIYVVCSVYGRHLNYEVDRMGIRNREAPFSALIDELVEMTWGT
jgi:hypothetical protein